MNGSIALNPLPAEWTEIAGGLELHATISFDSPTFRGFFEGYDRAFVLPDEKETLSGFKAGLALNHGDAYQRLAGRYGPFREVCCTFHDGGRFVGGANIFVTVLPPETGDAAVSSNLNYIYVNASDRGRGYLSKMLEGIQAMVSGLFSSVPGPGLMFIENNDPFRLSDEQYRLDTETSGVDQFDRLAIWARAGALVVDHPYVQPPLSADQEADNTLVLSVIGSSVSSLSACLLHDHLKSFFGVSVLKGLVDPTEDPETGSQLATLSARCTKGGRVQLLDPLPMLYSRGQSRRYGFWGETKPTSLIEFLKRQQNPG